MKICDFETLSLSEVLDVLSPAACRTFPAKQRVVISGADHSTGEGLALLGAYTSISNLEVRQALLDLALMLARKQR